MGKTAAKSWRNYRGPPRCFPGVGFGVRLIVGKAGFCHDVPVQFAFLF